MLIILKLGRTYVPVAYLQPNREMSKLLKKKNPKLDSKYFSEPSGSTLTRTLFYPTVASLSRTGNRENSIEKS